MKILGIGTRVLNYIIDTMLILLLSILSYNIWNWYVHFYLFKSQNFWVFFFIVQFVFYTFFEGVFSRSPGKWLSYSKVTNLNGNKIDFTHVLLRSLSRLIPIDMFFIPFLDKPLHDYLSKTILIEV